MPFFFSPFTDFRQLTSSVDSASAEIPASIHPPYALRPLEVLITIPEQGRCTAFLLGTLPLAALACQPS